MSEFSLEYTSALEREKELNRRYEDLFSFLQTNIKDSQVREQVSHVHMHTYTLVDVWNHTHTHAHTHTPPPSPGSPLLCCRKQHRLASCVSGFE